VESTLRQPQALHKRRGSVGAKRKQIPLAQKMTYPESVSLSAGELALGAQPNPSTEKASYCEALAAYSFQAVWKA